LAARPKASGFTNSVQRRFEISIILVAQMAHYVFDHYHRAIHHHAEIQRSQ